MLCPVIGSGKRKNGRQLHDVEAAEPSAVTLASGFGPGAIEPASVCGRDKVIYQCTDCGAEKTEIARTYRATIDGSKDRG